MERLAGGFINDCYHRDTVVVKEYQSDKLCGQEGSRRRERERMSLNKFGNGHGIAPTLIEMTPNTLLQEFLHGDVLENVQKTEEDLFYTGKLLRNIHTPVSRAFNITRSDYEGKFKRHVSKAIFILNEEGINPHIDINWNKVEESGTTRIHRDYWLGNVMRTRDANKLPSQRYKAIDWEFAGIGSPYEDFSIAHMWIFRVYGGEDFFWEGYGSTPDKDTIREFLKLKTVEFISRCGYNDYMNESKDGFYHKKTQILRGLI